MRSCISRTLDSSGAQTFAIALRQPPEFRRRLGEDLFNHLEDARIGAREHDVEPENDKYVEKLHRLAMEQEEAAYKRQEQQAPWTRTPPRAFPQLRLAFVERLLVSNRGSEVSPLVEKVLIESGPALSRGVAAATTQGARDAALEVLDIVFRHWEELVADLRS